MNQGCLVHGRLPGCFQRAKTSALPAARPADWPSWVTGATASSLRKRMQITIDAPGGQLPGPTAETRDQRWCADVARAARPCGGVRSDGTASWCAQTLSKQLIRQGMHRNDLCAGEDLLIDKKGHPDYRARRAASQQAIPVDAGQPPAAWRSSAVPAAAGEQLMEH